MREHEEKFHTALCGAVLFAGVCSFITLVWFRSAPYGRYSTTGWGTLIPPKVAWIFMETPNLWVACLAYATADPAHQRSMPNMILLGLFVFHYVNRAIIFPLRMRGGRPMPISVMLLAWLFCSVNGYLQSRFLCAMYIYPEDWIRDFRFILGVTMFFIGWSLNYQADAILRSLRGPGETGYKIPRGGLFEWVSGANFSAEIFEWTGFAVACWSLPALTFALFTFLNTAPRGVAHHRWYLEKFENYPKTRRAVIPLVW